MTRDIEDDPVDDGLLVREAFWIFRDTTVHMRDTYSYLSRTTLSCCPVAIGSVF
jgi:hypothetical protein